jgi:hypothetical protein
MRVAGVETCEELLEQWMPSAASQDGIARGNVLPGGGSIVDLTIGVFDLVHIGIELRLRDWSFPDKYNALAKPAALRIGEAKLVSDLAERIYRARMQPVAASIEGQAWKGLLVGPGPPARPAARLEYEKACSAIRKHPTGCKPGSTGANHDDIDIRFYLTTPR